MIHVSEPPRAEWALDDRLGLKARGLLGWLLQKPPTYSANARDITQEIPEGRGAVLSALAELENAGYVVRRKYQAHDGRWRSRSDVFDVARQNEGRSVRASGAEEFDRDELTATRRPVLAGFTTYQAMDEGGAVLYVGMSTNLKARLRSHSGRSPGSMWWQRAARIKVSWWPSVAAALDEEARQVESHAPPYNFTSGDLEDLPPEH